MSINDRLTQHLKRGSVGFPTALASTIGLIMASPVILTATMGFGIGGSAFAVAMLIAAVMMLAQATTFAEAASILPTTGSVYDYINCGMGRFLRDHRHVVGVPDRACVRGHGGNHSVRGHGAGELRAPQYPGRECRRFLVARG